MIEILTANWELVTLALLSVASILNYLTQHYSTRYAWMPSVFGAMLEFISVLTSKGTSNGVARRLKLPFQNCPPEGCDVSKRTRLPVVLIGLLLATSTGCAYWETQGKGNAKDALKCLQSCAVNCGAQAVSQALTACPIPLALPPPPQ